MSCKSLKRYKTRWKNEAAINHGIIRGLRANTLQGESWPWPNTDADKKSRCLPKKKEPSSYQRFNAITHRAALGDWTLFFSPVSTCNVTESSCRGTLGSSKSHSRWWHKTKHLLHQNTSKPPHPAPPSVCHSSAELHEAEHGEKKQKSVLLNKPVASKSCAESGRVVRVCAVCVRAIHHDGNSMWFKLSTSIYGLHMSKRQRFVSCCSCTSSTVSHTCRVCFKSYILLS